MAKVALMVAIFSLIWALFLGPVAKYFYKSKKVAVDVVINLSGFALVGGPASQDHPKAVKTLKGS